MLILNAGKGIRRLAGRLIPTEEKEETP